mmetsp:Transcript_14600/g.22006  ORF Transcript_14600/g.22006 Transcript_14600/m.22006 type:complete len:970 (+) Transcript_14600:113-3022(+)
MKEMMTRDPFQSSSSSNKSMEPKKRGRPPKSFSHSSDQILPPLRKKTRQISGSMLTGAASPSRGQVMGKTGYTDVNKRLLAEGWQIDTACSKWIGKKVRRFFVGHGAVDGTVVGYMPSDSAEGHPLWHVSHEDEDSEDMSESELELCSKLYDSEAKCLSNEEFQRLHEKCATISDRYPDSKVLAHFALRTGVTCSRVGSSYQADLSNLSPHEALPDNSGSVMTVCTESDSYEPVLHKEYLSRAHVAALLPGMVVQARLPSPHSLLIPVCLVAHLANGKVVVFDGSSHHTLLMTECVPPSVDELDIDGAWMNSGGRMDDAVLRVQRTAQLILSLQLSGSILELLLFAWKEHKSDLETGWRTHLRNVLSFKQLLGFYHTLCPVLLRDKSKQGWENLRRVYQCADAIRGTEISPPSSVSNSMIMEGDWGSEAEDEDVFYPSGPSFILENPSHASFPSSPRSVKRRGRGRREVEQIDLETGKVIAIYPSGVAAAAKIGGSQSSVSACCRGKTKQYGGYRWRFVERDCEDLSSVGHISTQDTTHSLFASTSDYDSWQSDNSDDDFREASKVHVREQHIVKYDTETGETIAVYATVVAAALALGEMRTCKSETAISSCCRGTRRAYAGYGWRFAKKHELIHNGLSTHGQRADADSNSSSRSDVESNAVSDDDVEKKLDVGGMTRPRKQGRKVVQCDYDTGAVIAVYPSGKAAANAVGGRQSSISSCCTGRFKSHLGFRWRFVSITDNNSSEATLLHEHAKKRPGRPSRGRKKKAARQMPAKRMKASNLRGSISSRKGRAVEQYDLETGETVAIHPSGVAAANAINGTQSVISACCRGVKEEHRGFGWRFADGNSDLADVSMADDDGYNEANSEEFTVLKDDKCELHVDAANRQGVQVHDSSDVHQSSNYSTGSGSSMKSSVDLGTGARNEADVISDENFENYSSKGSLDSDGSEDCSIISGLSSSDEENDESLYI